jgi:hypothetical protein
MATLFRDVLLSRAIFLLSSHRNQYLLPFRFSIGSFQTRIAAVGPRSAMLTSQSSDMRQQKRRARTFNGNEGIDFVRCRICGDYRRVISARHLSKHGIEREAYMEEYHLSPDELIAKAFRRIQSSRTGYYPYGKSDWIAAIKKVYRTDGDISAKYLQDNYHHIYVQGVWIYGDWDKALGAAGFNPERMRYAVFGIRIKSSQEYAKSDAKSYRLMPIM